VLIITNRRRVVRARWLLLAAVSALAVAALAIIVVFFRPTLSPIALPPDVPLAITEVTVIDVISGASHPNTTVFIQDGRIRAIWPKTDSAAVPTGATIVSGRGRFLIPGLWDMHTHRSGAAARRALYSHLLVANGITGIRVMESSLPPERIGEAEPTWDNRSIEPRAVVSGRVINADGFSRTSFHLRTSKDVPAVLDSLRRSRADFVKVYNVVPREAYFALLAEARRRHTVVAGHVPWSVTAIEASDSGQKSLEHLSGVMLSCSSRESELSLQLNQKREPGPGLANLVQRIERAAIESYDAGRCHALGVHLARNGTWLVPTFVSLRKRYIAPDSTNTFEYIPGWRRRSAQNRAYMLERPADGQASDLRVFQRQLGAVRTLHGLGVNMMAGTDMLADLVVPGFSLHDELELLVAAGFTPLEALQAATVQPALYLDAVDSAGTIEVGKVADLVLLDGDPLADIRNTRRIHAVVLRGRLLESDQLSQMLRNARRYVRRYEIAERLKLDGWLDE
jgi:hypothetical protein